MTDNRSLFEQRLVDATPPADFPAQCIVVDHQSKAPYYLRVTANDRQVDHIELEDANGAAMSLVAAVQICVREGYDPTHYIEIKGADRAYGPWLIPTGIVRRPATPARPKSTA